MAEYLHLVTRTLLILLLLLVIARILGRRTLSELTFYDFVIGLVIGHIGGSVITDKEFSFSSGIISLAVATLWVLAINSLVLKSVPARKLIESEPLMVIHKGKILEENLKKRYYNVNDILEMLREQGSFDPRQVEVALIEADGQLSVLLKQEYQSPTKQDFTLPKQGRTPASNLVGKEIIIDGKIINKVLAQSGITTAQLQDQLNQQGIINISDVTLAMLTPDGKLYVDQKKDQINTPNS